ncbi:hypothetical protein ACFLRB_00290 [Acidobacteriota bacterium]
MKKNFFSLTFVFMLILYLLPMALSKKLPCQDVPNHMAIIHTLAAENVEPGWQRHFENNLQAAPYSTYYWLGVQLTKLFDAEGANRIILCLYGILLPLSFLFLLLSIDGSLKWNVFFSFPLIYSDLYLLGFTNFMLTLPLFLLMTGLAVKFIKAETTDYKNLFLIGVLTIVIFNTHPFTQFIFMGLIFLALPLFIKKMKRILLVFSATLPGLLLLFLWMKTSSGFSTIDYLPLTFKIEYLVLTPFLFTEASSRFLFYIIILLVLVLLGLFVINQKKSSKENKPIREKPNHNFRKGIIFLSSLFLLYFFSPYAAGATIWFDLRIAIFVWLSLFTLIMPHLLKNRTAKAIILMICFINLVGIMSGHYRFNGEIKPLFKMIDRMEPDARILPILIDPGSKTINPFYFRDGVIPYFSLFTHFGSYYHVEKGGESPFMTFYPGLDHIPLKLRNPIYREVFRISDPFNPNRLLKIVPHITGYFDYILVRGTNMERLAYLSKLAALKFQAGHYYLFETTGN